MEQTQQMTEGFSVWLETYINLDGRYDLRRGIKELHDLDNEAFKVNYVYSQKDNFFEYYTHYKLLDADKFDHTFI